MGAKGKDTSIPVGHRQVHTPKAVTRSGQPPNRLRWLAAGLVIAAILFILFFKMASTRATANLSVAEAGAAATVPVLNTSPAASPSTVAPATPASDPFPSQPEAQVDWVLRNGRPALFLFHSTNCKPCIAMTALVEQIRPDYDGRIVFVDVITNDAANAAVVRRAGIQSIPTTFFITSSGSGQGYIGLMKEEDVRAELDKLVLPE
jgi:thiol-disulfide isomerase/thioredoxin